MNGKLAFNVTMDGIEFTFAGQEIAFGNNLVLGASFWQNSGNSSGFSQSEASVANLNIYSRGLSELEMVELTSGGKCTEGDLVGWSSTKWKHTGEVQTLVTEELCQQRSSNLVLLPFPLLWRDCVTTCPRLATGGRLPQVGNLKEAQDLLANLNGMVDLVEEGWVWAPWRLKEENHFVDSYTGKTMASGLWVSGQPNGGLGQQCSGWWKSSDQVREGGKSQLDQISKPNL